jgi:hypothetical protein
LAAIQQEVADGSALAKGMTAQLELMQYSQFYNEHLYVLKMIFKL